jgi:tetratricopeptide (TPR) repeat protein
VAESVVLLEVENEAGNVVGQGSGFLVEGDRIVTNAHVVREGKPFLKVSGFRIACSIDRTDDVVDLALLTIKGRASAPPLTLAATLPTNGEAIYALGNPRGLERTITQGLYTGIRTIENRELLQISAPISPGSSGGPVVNGNGDVIGVAVGSLQQGQNLNFAVPLNTLRRFLSGPSDHSESADSLLAAVERLKTERDATEYSKDADSPYQKLDTQVKLVSIRAFQASEGSAQKLIRLSELLEYEEGTTAIKAAEKAVELTNGNDARSHIALAEALYAGSIWAPDSDESGLLAKAEAHAQRAVKLNVNAGAAEYALLAQIQENQSKLGDAYLNYRRALDLRKKTDPNSVVQDRYSLFGVTSKLGRVDEAKKWFAAVAASGYANAWHWINYAQFLEKQRLEIEAGDAYTMAAEVGGSYRNYCDAAGAYWFNDDSKALVSARLCIEKGATQRGSESSLAYAHRILAAILSRRGVYEEALSHARQSIAIDPSDAWAYHFMSVALSSLKRHDEAISASTNALRLSDGQYALMHFALGSAYFEKKDWAQAAQAFEKAAQLNPADDDAAYNVAAALYNNGFRRESVRWWEEVLKRNPSHPDKTTILDNIRKIRNGS